MTNKNWTVVKLKNGKTLEGIVTNETDSHLSLYRLPYPILKRNIVKRDEHRIGVLTTQMY